jgi:hypothetical protein
VANSSADGAPPVVAEVERNSEMLRLVFPFRSPTSAAVFRRADTLWLIFDTTAPVDISRLVLQPIAPIRSAIVSRSDGGEVVRLRLDRPKLASLSLDGSTWTVAIGDIMLGPTQPLAITRAVRTAGKASAVIAFAEAQRVHRLADPEIGDTLLAVTALGPARGFLSPQDFVEFRALASAHGVVVQPLADDLSVDVAAGKVVIARPAGLTISGTTPRSAETSAETPGALSRPGVSRAYAFDSQLWAFDQQADFWSRQSELIREAAGAPDEKRSAMQLDLARFYLARRLHVEAKGVLDVVLSTMSPDTEDAATIVLHAVANIMLGRNGEALKDLSRPSVGKHQDASLWRGVALARQGKWAEARDGLQAIGGAAVLLPPELQQVAYQEAVRAAIEVGDYADATSQLHQFDLLGVAPELAPAMNVLRGRIAMSHKPARAIQVLRATRGGDLPTELRNQRLLLEARALSETGRHDLALEVVANVPGREADRLRADVLWAGRKWRESAEQVERFYGDRWRDFAPLTATERADILRAGIGYALAEDQLGLDRFREKYAAKMAEGPDRKAFEVVTAPLNAGRAEFSEVAKAVSSVDTLDGFLRDIRARFPDSTGPAPQSGTPAPQSGAQAGSQPS